MSFIEPIIATEAANPISTFLRYRARMESNNASESGTYDQKCLYAMRQAMVAAADEIERVHGGLIPAGECPPIR